MNALSLCLTLALLAPAASDQQAQSKDFLSRPLVMPAYIMGGMHVAGITVLREARTPGGLVIRMASCDAEEKRLFKFDSKTLKGALDALVTTDPQYEWKQTDGVVNIVPRAGVPLLDARIPSLDVTNEVSAQLVFEQVIRSPAVHRKAAQLGLIAEEYHRGGMYTIRRPGTDSGQSGRLITIHGKNLTVRQALNALVAAEGQGYWELTLRPCGGKTNYEFSLHISDASEGEGNGA